MQAPSWANLGFPGFYNQRGGAGSYCCLVRFFFEVFSAVIPKLILAQFGCGYWGPNLLRNFSALPGCTVKYVVDSSAERRGFVESNFPLSRAIDTHQTVLDDPSVDGVVIATPAAS